MSHLPAVIAAELTIHFSRPRTKAELESFFRSLVQQLFDIATTRGSFLGHIKIFGEAAQHAFVRANLAGDRDSVRVELQGVRGQTRFRVTLNVIAYKVDETKLRRRFDEVLADTVRRFGASLSRVRVSSGHQH